MFNVAPSSVSVRFTTQSTNLATALFAVYYYCYCYVMYSFVSLSILIVMNVPFWVFHVIVLFCVPFVCKCVLYYCHRQGIDSW
jgi:hypothetical protein